MSRCRTQLRLGAVLRSRCVLVLFALVAFGGCATMQAPSEVVEMEPLEFRARMEGGRVVVDTLDPQVLFQEGAEAYKRKKLQEAAEMFERLVAEFPEHELANSARFNAGLAREESGETKAALTLYLAYLAATSVERERVDGLFRASECMAKLGEWPQMRTTVDELLTLRLNVLDRAHALALSGFAWQHLGELAQAERNYEAVLALSQEHSELTLFRGNYHVAMAQYQIGELYRTLFGAIHFRLPLERMERDLDDKSRLFLKAQNAYLKAVRIKNGHWAVVAGFQIGAIYEQFYQDFMTAEVPSELSAEEVAVYVEELRIKIRPLIDRAVEVYERNILMSERVGLENSEWTERARQRLEALRALLRDSEPSPGPSAMWRAN